MTASYLPSPPYYCEIFPVPAVITVVTGGITAFTVTVSSSSIVGLWRRAWHSNASGRGMRYGTEQWSVCYCVGRVRLTGFHCWPRRDLAVGNINVASFTWRWTGFRTRHVCCVTYAF